MAAIHVVPTLETISNSPSVFKNIELAIFNGARQVGEAKLVLMNYNTIRIKGERLETIARHVSEDMHQALSALSKHALFACEVLCDTDRMYCRVPIIAYLARIYIYPEYQSKGYGKAFIQMLPDIIQNITLSTPLAIAVYISPQGQAVHHNGDTNKMVKKDIKAMQSIMEKTFTSAGYMKPSKAINHKRCWAWTEGENYEITRH